MKKLAALLLAVTFSAALCPLTHAAGYTVTITPQYNMTESHGGKITKLSKNTKWALADASGNPTTPFQWDAIGDVDTDYIPAKSGGKWGYISPSGKVLIPYGYLFAGAFQNGVAVVQTQDLEYVYINMHGKTLFQSPFTYSFSPSGGAICGVIDDLYGYCDTDGNMIIKPQFEMAFDFHEGYAGVQSGNKWGFINTDGQYAIRPAYDYVTDFQNGYAICRLSGKYGIINTAGKKTSAFTFDYIGFPGDNGWYPAKVGSVSGYINTRGQWMLKTKYQFCYRFTNGVARVYHDGVWGYIDEAGKELIAPSFVDLGEYHSDCAPFSEDGCLWGYLTLDFSVEEEPVSQTETPPVVMPPVVENPAATEEPPKGNTASTGTLVPEILNPANDTSRPLDPKSARCISMKINSVLTLKDAEEIALSQPPALLNGTTMIPLRDIVELLGGTVEWNAAQRRINLKWNYINISMTADSKIFYVNGTPQYLLTAPVIINGTTMVPLRSITDALRCKIEWVDTCQNIYIYY